MNTLLYFLREEIESVLNSTNITEEERKDYASVLAMFNKFFQVRRNVIFKRVRFNRWFQWPGKSVEQFIVELYYLAEHCDYGTLKSEIIRDRLVVGIQDDALSQRLHLDPNLTLDKAKKLIRQRKVVQEQQQVLKGKPSSDLDELQRGYSVPQSSKWYKATTTTAEVKAIQAETVWRQILLPLWKRITLKGEMSY